MSLPGRNRPATAGSSTDEHPAESLTGGGLTDSEQARLLDLSFDAIILTDRSETIRFWNRGAEQMYGFPKHEAIGSSLHTILRTDFPETRKAMRETLERDGRWEGELTHKRRDGSPVVVAGRSTLERDARGDVTAIFISHTDVTLRKRAEEALRESSQFSREVVASAGEGIIVCDRNLRYLVWNPWMEALTGIASREVLGRMALEVFPHLRETGVDKLFARALAGEIVSSPDVPYRVPGTGKSGWVSATYAPHRNASGEIIGVIATVRDVSARKRAEAIQGALYRISETASSAEDMDEFYSALHAIIGELMYAKNFYIALYDAASQTLSFPYFADEVDARPVRKKPGKGLTEYVLRTGHPLLASQKTFAELAARGDVELVGASSEDWLGVPLKRGQTIFGVLAVQSYSSDVGFGEEDRDVLTFVSQHIAAALERKRAQSAHRENEEMLRSIIETTKEWIWSIDRDGRQTYSNPAVEAILGYRPEELMGKNSLDFMHEEDRRIVEAELPKFVAQKVGWSGLVLRWRHRDGGYRYLESHAVPILGPAGELLGYRGADRDITERKQLENQLLQSQKMEAVGRLAGGVAHDFNNLLTTILGYSELALGQLLEDHPVRADLLEVRKAGKRAAALTQQLLAFSRKQLLLLEVLDLNAVVADVEKMLSRLIGEDVRLETVLDPELAQVRADRGQLEQVIMNLAVNARDAMPSGGTLTLETRNCELDETYTRNHEGSRPGAYVLLSVRDTGAGMGPETQAHIFEPFFTTKEKGKGTGLGLATVYGIVKQSGGYIAVESAPNRGSVFQIYLPRVAEAAPALSAAV